MVISMNLQLKLIVLTIIIHVIDTFTYSVRLNSVKKGNFALSSSLFNIISLVSRTANMFQGPLIGLMIEKSIEMSYDPIYEVRKVVFAATLGTILAGLSVPTFLELFAKGVAKLEVTGSIPGLVMNSLGLSNIKRIARSTRRPRKNMISNLRFKNIPKRLLLLNAFITGIYSIGVLAAYYAAIYVPEKRLAVSASSGMINGIASILLAFFIDPQASIITDEAYRGKRQIGDVKALVVMLIATKLLGTLLGQLLLIPSAKLLAFYYR